jgi:amidophosphoribosyltransferase
LIPIRELVEGKSIVFCEDSIVRGTQLRNMIRRLYDYGAKEVHMRPACPPLIYGCKFLNFSRSRSVMDLAGRKAIDGLERLEGKEPSPELLFEYSDPDSEKHKKMTEWIKVDLGLTSLKYQRLPNLIDAIGLKKERLCTYCWDGAEIKK